MQTTDNPDNHAELRPEVLDRDDHSCRFCEINNEEHKEEFGRGLHLHHIIPQRDGGENILANLIAVCHSCHRQLDLTHGRAVSQLEDVQYDIRSDQVMEEIGRIRRKLEVRFDDLIADKDTLPELEDRSIPEWRLDQMTRFQRLVYEIGKVEGQRKALGLVESSVDEVDRRGDSGLRSGRRFGGSVSIQKNNGRYSVTIPKYLAEMMELDESLHWFYDGFGPAIAYPLNDEERNDRS